MCDVWCDEMRCDEEVVRGGRGGGGGVSEWVSEAGMQSKTRNRTSESGGKKIVS